MSFIPHSVLITGANRGIGLEFVRQLLQLKPVPKVIATVRDPIKATELQKLASDNPSNVHVLKFEITNYDGLPNFVEQVKSSLGDNGLSLLINNAGIAMRENFDAVSAEGMVQTFQVNTVAPLLLTRALFPLLKQSAQSGKRTLVANITSRMGSIDDNGSGGYYAYRSSKAALNMVTKSLSVDLKPYKIEATVIHPGWVQTEMGGPHAKITVQTSVESMLKNICDANKNINGKFLDYTGSEIPW